MTYLGINLTKYVQNLDEETCRTLMKDIKEVNRKIVHVHGLEDSTLLRCLFFPT